MKPEFGFYRSNEEDAGETKNKQSIELETLTRYFLAAFPLKETDGCLAENYTVFIKRVHEAIVQVYFDLDIKVQKIESLVNDLKESFSLLSRDIILSEENQKFLADLLEHVHDLVGRAAFDKAAYEKIIDSKLNNSDPVVPFLVLKEKNRDSLIEGARVLLEMQRETPEIVVGQKDVVVEFPFGNGLFRLAPGEAVLVKAIIPPDYFKEKFPNFNPVQQTAAAVQTLIRNQVAALTWLKKPVERSTLGQLGGELRTLSLDPELIKVNADGSVIVDMALFNRNAGQALIFDGQVAQPMFRLFIDPSRGLLIGENLLVTAQKIIGENFDPNLHLVRQHGEVVALRIPVTKYAVREKRKIDEINVSDILAGNSLSRKRDSIDTLLGIAGWSQNPNDFDCPSGTSMILGQTSRVNFPPDVTGVISQKMLVDHEGQVAFFARHGGSRVIDPLFSQPIRTEFITHVDDDKEFGRQSLVVYLYKSQKK